MKTSKSNRLTREGRKRPPLLDRMLRYHAIHAGRLWKYFSPYRPNDLLKIYYHILYTKILLFLIVFRGFLYNTMRTLLAPSSITPLIFLMSILITLNVSFRLTIGG